MGSMGVTDAVLVFSIYFLSTGFIDDQLRLPSDQFASVPKLRLYIMR